MSNRRSRWHGERGAEAVEFAIIVPVLILLICGIIDFGFTYGGYISMEHGVESASRQASTNAATYSGGTCKGGSGTSNTTAAVVCDTIQDVGSLSGVDTSSFSVGVCFFVEGSNSPSCASGTTGESDTMDVEVCVQAKLHSITGVMAPFLNGRLVTTSSRLLLEEPQPSDTSTSYAAFGSGQTVTFGSSTVQGINCPVPAGGS